MAWCLLIGFVSLGLQTWPGKKIDRISKSQREPTNGVIGINWLCNQIASTPRKFGIKNCEKTDVESLYIIGKV